MNGFILINKTKGVSSNNEVQKVKKILSVNKVGHLGTLDPIATGLLILAINRATKFSSYLLDSDKSYNTKIKLGISTDTDDSTGKILSQMPVNVSLCELKDNLKSFLGESMQVPPFFSALKHKGKPLYKFAREGKYIEKPSRKINIKNISNIKLDNDVCSFSIECSKGTYIRSIARDLGNRLECGAHMIALERTRQATFEIYDAVSASEVNAKNVIPIELAFNDYKKINISDDEVKKFKNGVQIEFKQRHEDIYKVYDKNSVFLGLGMIHGSYLKHKQLV